MGTIRKRGIRYRAEICVAGVRQSRTFDFKKQAQRWIMEREQSLQDDPMQAGKISLREVMERYAAEVSPHKKTHKKEVLKIQALIRGASFTDLPIRQITPDHLGRWRNERLRQVSASTVLRELNLWSHIFSVATKEWQLIPANPCSDVTRPKEPPPRDRRISQHEIDLICYQLGLDAPDKKPENISQRVAVAFLFAIETAMRVKEICGLRPEHVADSVAQLLDTKTRPRKVPLSNEARRLLELVGGNFELNPSQIDALFRKARDRCGIEDLHFHDTRHEAITRLAQKLDVLALARMVGHRDIRQLMAYYNESPSDIAQKLN